ncbi:MAG: 3-phosphoshikimate 1-carboxyvinyltransferase [Candidatus Micrarchaeota archaeon]
MKITPGSVAGKIKAPPSKSMMQRAVAIAALAKGTSTIANPSFCDDSLAAIEIVKALGARVVVNNDFVEIIGSENGPVSDTLNCNESGFCMRMFTPIAALFNKKISITGKSSLLNRPVDMIEKPLRDMGAEVSTNNKKPPITVKGPIKGGEITVDGSVSSQFVSGLLIALPMCRNDSVVKIVNLKSKSYVTMTKSVVSSFGGSVRLDEGMTMLEVDGNQAYKGREITIEGDWSGAAFMLVAGAIAGEVGLEELTDSDQPDQEILSVLVKTWANIKLSKNSVSVSRSELQAFEFDATNSPDLFPPLVALACNCKGKSVISGVGRLLHKESNRATALLDEFTKIGANIKIIDDRMEIVGGKLKGGIIDSHGDHRIAMAGAIAALNSETGVEIKNHECVSKSYPKFFEDLKRLRA